jgi:hypothetical protein
VARLIELPNAQCDTCMKAPGTHRVENDRMTIGPLCLDCGRVMVARVDALELGLERAPAELQRIRAAEASHAG